MSRSGIDRRGFLSRIGAAAAAGAAGVALSKVEKPKDIVVPDTKPDNRQEMIDEFRAGFSDKNVGWNDFVRERTVDHKKRVSNRENLLDVI